MAISKKITGSALITALFIMTLMAAAATALIYEQELTIANAQQNFNYSRALQYNQIVTDWAIDRLGQNLTGPMGPTNLQQTLDVIPAFYPTTHILGGKYRGILFDMQAKFNINNLRDPDKWSAGFINMLKTVLPNLQDPTALTHAIINYISPASNDPRDDDAYQKAGLPYEPPHQAMLNISELRKVLGVTASLYQSLTPYVTAIPSKTTDTAININTAPLPDLMILSPSISLETAKIIASKRPYQSTADFNANPIIQNHAITGIPTAVSDFFIARSLVEMDKQQLLTSNYLFRDPTNRTVTVMWQTQGNSE